VKYNAIQSLDTGMRNVERERERERGTSENYATFQKALMQIYV